MLKLPCNFKLNLSSRIMELAGDVDADFYYRFVVGYRALVAASSTEPILILLNTDGGDFHTALAVYDILQMKQQPVAIVANGACMSSGAIILQGASEGHRYATPRTSLMVHFGSETNTSEEVAKHSAKLLKINKEIYEKRVKVSRRTLNSWFNREAVFTAAEAQKVGLIDGIIGE